MIGISTQEFCEESAPGTAGEKIGIVIGAQDIQFRGTPRVAGSAFKVVS